MKKNIFRAYALMAVAVVFSSCNNAAPKMDEEPVAEAGVCVLPTSRLIL